MECYVGVEVAVKHTAICIIDRDSRVMRQATSYTERESLAAFLHGTGLPLARLVSGERYKGVDEMLEALPRLRREVPDIVYLVRGDGSDRPRGKHRRRLFRWRQ